MGKAAVAIELTAPERRELESLAPAHRTGQAMARRARIVLAAAAGLENKAICAAVGADANTILKWRHRFATQRLDGLLDEPRPGTPRKIGDDQIAETIRLTLETAPPGATHWSLRWMAKAVGYAPSTIHRIWRAFGLQPHRSETFKLSSDPLTSGRMSHSASPSVAPPPRAKPSAGRPGRPRASARSARRRSRPRHAGPRSRPAAPAPPGSPPAAAPGRARQPRPSPARVPPPASAPKRDCWWTAPSPKRLVSLACRFTLANHFLKPQHSEKFLL